jgi:hypothetical protein
MCRVKRGQDWNKEDQDGGVGNLGTVLGYKIADGSVFAPDSVAKVTAVSACVFVRGTSLHIRAQTAAKIPAKCAIVKWDGPPGVKMKRHFYPIGRTAPPPYSRC